MIVWAVLAICWRVVGGGVAWRVEVIDPRDEESAEKFFPAPRCTLPQAFTLWPHTESERKMLTPATGNKQPPSPADATLSTCDATVTPNDFLARDAPVAEAMRHLSAPRAVKQAGLNGVMAEIVVARCVFRHLDLYSAGALCVASMECGKNASSLCLQPEFWEGRAVEQEGSRPVSPMAFFAASAFMRLPPHALTTAASGLEDMLLREGARGRKWYRGLVGDASLVAIEATLGHILRRNVSWHSSQALSQGSSPWRAEAVARFFLAFWPADSPYPRTEFDSEVLAEEFVRFSRAAGIVGDASDIGVFRVIKAVLASGSAGDDAAPWAPEPKAAWVASLLLFPTPPRAVDPALTFSLADVLPLGASLGLKGDDSEALEKLVRELGQSCDVPRAADAQQVEDAPDEEEEEEEEEEELVAFTKAELLLPEAPSPPLSEHDADLVEPPPPLEFTCRALVPASVAL